jgi:hypothetical protein
LADASLADLCLDLAAQSSFDHHAHHAGAKPGPADRVDMRATAFLPNENDLTL